MLMTAKESAIKDIMDDLKQNSKCFVSFRKSLNPIMREMVNNYIKLQENAENKVQSR